MNQYRCETCKFHYPPYGCESVVLESLERIPGEDAVCPWQIMEINEGKGWEGDSEPIEFEQLEAITALVGCVSHSNFLQCERDKVRPEVMMFAKEMERVLKKNDHKGGWEEMSLGSIFDRLQEEMDEAEHAWDTVKKREHYEKVSDELIDVANFCMMFWDNLHPELRQAGEP
jgi:NTP pyrophosphatase (non-canonical NTP hydrolase)